MYHTYMSARWTRPWPTRLQVWDLATYTVRHTLSGGHGGAAVHAVCSFGSTRALSGGADHAIRVRTCGARRRRRQKRSTPCLLASPAKDLALHLEL
jgi:hypothetical protein